MAAFPHDYQLERRLAAGYVRLLSKKSWDEIGMIEVNNFVFDFEVKISDVIFDNEDNPYGEFKLHYYNYTSDGTFNDIIVPFKTDCNVIGGNDIWDFSK